MKQANQMKTLTFSLLLFFYFPSLSQNHPALTLEELIKIAQQRSIRSQVINMEKKIASYEYNYFLRTRKASILLNGNIPVYNKDNFGVIQPDGTLLFRSRSQSNSDANLSIRQPIAFTNGEISLNTYLNRFDDYKDKRTSYNATLFYVQLYQPLFAFNQYKWDKRIQPLRFKASERIATTAMNEFQLLLCQLYFDVIQAQVDMELAHTNLSYAKDNRAAEQRRKELGASTEDKQLQLEMMELDAAQSLEESQTRLASSMSILKNFAGLDPSANINLKLPAAPDTTAISIDALLSSAQATHPVFLNASLELLEAESAVDRARTEEREVNITGSYGLNNTGNTISSLYNQPNNQQRFSIGLTIPIYDGGRRRTKLLIARNNQQLVSARNKEEVQTLVNEITRIYNDYNYARTNIARLQKLDSIGERRFAITNRLFTAGKIPVNDLQLAQREKDNARRNYVGALRKLTEQRYAITARTGMQLQ